VLVPRAGPLAGIFAAVFFGFNYYLMIYGRLGLMEPALNGMLLLSFLFLAMSLDSPKHFILAALFFLASYYIKQSGIIFLPVLVLGFAMGPGFFLFREGRARTWSVFGLVLLALIFVIIFYPLLDADYRLRSVMNLRHALDYMPDVSRRWMQPKASTTLDALRFAFSGQGFFKGYVMMLPVSGMLALVEIFIFGYLAIWRRHWDRFEVLIVLWFFVRAWRWPLPLTR